MTSAPAHRPIDRPTTPTDWVARACRALETEDPAPALADLAARLGMSRAHFQRRFTDAMGLSPKAYATAARAQTLRSRLRHPNASITAAVYASGFNSSSRFYDTSDRVLGMTARAYRAGGAGETIVFAVGQCTLGAIVVAQSSRGVCAIALGDDPDALVRDLQDQFPQAHLVGGDRTFEDTVARVVGLVEAPHLGWDVPLDIRGTAFQERVWRALREIPPGTTVSYSAIAERIGAPRAVRAVAQSCAANRLAVAVPCHRVVRRDGDVSGYRWGVERKRALLEREREREAPATA